MKYEIFNQDYNIQAMVDCMVKELKRIDPKYENIEPHILNTLTQNYIHQMEETGNSEFVDLIEKTLNIQIPDDEEISIEEV